MTHPGWMLAGRLEALRRGPDAEHPGLSECSYFLTYHSALTAV
jgi:hypothetical protein